MDTESSVDVPTRGTGQRVRVWDPLIRLFHWTLVVAFLTNALIDNPEGRLHVWLGFLALGLVGFRLVWGLIGPRYARFSSFPPSLAASMQQLSDMATGRRKAHLGHTPLGGLMIYNLLATLVAIGVTGWMMTTDRFWGVDWVEELHGALVSWAEISVVLHVAAVIWESRRTGVNLPRAMISGVKTLPGGVETEE